MFVRPAVPISEVCCVKCASNMNFMFIENKLAITVFVLTECNQVDPKPGLQFLVLSVSDLDCRN